MIKRILIVIGSIIGIILYGYLHGRLWQIMSPDTFGKTCFWLYVVVGIPFSMVFTMLYFTIAVLVWPIIGGTINYIVGEELCSVPNDDPTTYDE